MQGYNFSEHVRLALQGARNAAIRLHQEYVGPGHIFLGILSTPDSRAISALNALKIDLTSVRAKVEASLKSDPAGAQTGPDLPYTTRAKKVLELSMSEARELDASYVGTEHVLLGLIREQASAAAQLLVQSGATADVVRAVVLQQQESAPPAPRPDPRTAPPSGSARPSSVTVLAEFSNGRIQATRFERLEDAVAHLSQWLAS